MNKDTVSLLEGKVFAHTLDYLMELFKGGNLPDETATAIFIAMRKMAMGGMVPLEIIEELKPLLEKTVEDSLEKLTAPADSQKNKEDAVRKEVRTEPDLTSRAEAQIPHKEKEKPLQKQYPKKTTILDEKEMLEKTNGITQTFSKIEPGNVCEIESHLSFPITNSRLAVFLDVLAKPSYSPRDMHWEESLVEEMEKIKEKASARSVPVKKIILVEKDRSISIREEDKLYGLTFLAGESSSILIWTKDDRLCPWKKPEKTRLEDLMSVEGIEPADLRSILIVKSPIDGNTEIDFIKFVK